MMDSKVTKVSEGSESPNALLAFVKSIGATGFTHVPNDEQDDTDNRNNERTLREAAKGCGTFGYLKRACQQELVSSYGYGVNARLPRNEKGWPSPGPGRRHGSGLEIIDLSVWHPALRATMYNICTAALTNEECPKCLGFEPAVALRRLSSREKEFRRPSSALEGRIWCTGIAMANLGVVCKVPALAGDGICVVIYNIEANGEDDGHLVEGCCSMCRDQPSCTHIKDVFKAFKSISDSADIDVIDMLDAVDAHILGTCMSNRHCDDPVFFFGARSIVYFAVVAEAGALTLLKRTRSKQWVCKDGSCIHITARADCSHTVSVKRREAQLGPGGVLESVAASTAKSQGDTPTRAPNRSLPVEIQSRHRRRLVPSARAADIDAQITVSSLLAPAVAQDCIFSAPTLCCECGQRRLREGEDPSMKVYTSLGTVECRRGVIQAAVQYWRCKCGHVVWVEDCSHGREGLVWLTRYTAYTEVFLFETLMLLVFGGTTLAPLSSSRVEVSGLQSAGSAGLAFKMKGKQTFRSGFFLYLSLLVPYLPPWISRCETCSSRDHHAPVSSTQDGCVMYTSFCMDGLQIGYRLPRSSHVSQPLLHEGVRPSIQQPVHYHSVAAKLLHVIGNKSLRDIIFECLRARQIPQKASSADALAAHVLKFALTSKSAVRAAIASIRLFDPKGISRASSVPVESYRLTSHNLTCPNCAAGNDCTGRIEELYATDPLRLIVDGAPPQASERHADALSISEVFTELVDCRRMAQMIAVAIGHLSQERKAHVRHALVDWLQKYIEESQATLNTWISSVAGEDDAEGSEMTFSPADQADSGVSEHAKQYSLGAKGTPSLQWKVQRGSLVTRRADLSEVELALQALQVRLRPVAGRVAAYDATVRVLMLVNAVLHSPSSVWRGTGGFSAFNTLTQALQGATSSSDPQSTSSNYAHDAFLEALEASEVMAMPLLREAMRAMSHIFPLSAAVRRVVINLLQAAARAHQRYVDAMVQEPRGMKPGFISPNAFDRTWFNPSTPASTAMLANHFSKDEINEASDFLMSGVWAPDFPAPIRPAPSDLAGPAVFPAEEAPCVKNYKTHNAFSPGTFIFTCMCSHPKTFACIVLRKPEGSRSPLNFITERFPVPATGLLNINYDFACGASRSTIGTSMYLTEHCRFVTDRFHFSGHKACSLAYHPDSFQVFRGKNTESQEQRNAQARRLAPFLRSLGKKRFIAFTAVYHSLFNAVAKYKDVHRGSSTDGWTTWLRDVMEPMYEESPDYVAAYDTARQCHESASAGVTC